ncbi:hypothetical protein KY338_00085 [Candidatus Woesearchaeota archaeon]|nr:hypothetical protein [Candidatus Woesearchaeota archaeon]MBW3005280.1 hypothetical protein [Candidatus Woesearchaeota archaeon]
MVSGRHKAYERAEPLEDSLANDTSAAAFELRLTVREDASIGKRFITVEGKKFYRKTINKLVKEARDPKKDSIFLFRYDGETPRPVDANGKKYVGLLKLKGRGGFKRFIVYDYEDKKIERRVKEARMKLETQPHEQEGRDDLYLDDIALLEDEC